MVLMRIFQTIHMPIFADIENMLKMRDEYYEMLFLELWLTLLLQFGNPRLDRTIKSLL
jgi:hypothetical protein